jgi:ABC-2 type transport system permease protein
MIWRALGAIIARELTRMIRQKGRLVSSMVRPLMWLVLVGTGFQGMVAGFAGIGYQQFLAPGLLCMVTLFGAMLASLSLVYDKESGVMRMLVMAPFAHYWIILARIASATMVGLIQALLLMTLLLPLGYLGAPNSLTLLATALFLTSLACASVGMTIAVFSKTLDNFAVLMNFVLFPMFFLSGALYPLKHLPVALKFIAACNPLSYGVDAVKHALLPAAAITSTDFSAAQDLCMLLAIAVIAMIIACLRFSQTDVMERWARILSTPKRG